MHKVAVTQTGGIVRISSAAGFCYDGAQRGSPPNSVIRQNPALEAEGVQDVVCPRGRRVADNVVCHEVGLDADQTC